jgi:hypothetical protein
MVPDGLQYSLDEVVRIQLRVRAIQHFLKAAVGVFLHVLRVAATGLAAALFLFPVVLCLYLVHLLAKGIRLFGNFFNFSRGKSIHHIFVEDPKFLFKNVILLFFKGLLFFRVIGLALVVLLKDLLLLLEHLLLLILLDLEHVSQALLLQHLLYLLNCQVGIFLEQLLLESQYLMIFIILVFQLLLHLLL